MELLQYYNQTRFLSYVPKIKENLREWQLVEIKLAEGRTNIVFLAKQVKDFFSSREGILFICNRKEILALVRMGSINSANLGADLTGNLPQYSCTAMTTDLTHDGLLKFQLRLAEIDTAGGGDTSSTPLLEERKQRTEKVVMVADDDMFMRSLVAKAFKGTARVVEIDDTSKVIDTYLAELPDVLFLDIHMPGGSGIDALKDLLSFDDSAYVIIVSSDGVLDNVVDAKKVGAKGFVVKPFTTEKLLACYNKSPSVCTDERQ